MIEMHNIYPSKKAKKGAKYKDSGTIHFDKEIIQ